MSKSRLSDFKLQHKKVLKSYSKHLQAQGYSEFSMRKYNDTAETFCLKMIAKKLMPAGLCDKVIDNLTKEFVDAAFPYDKKHCRYRLKHLREFLIENYDAPEKAEPVIDMSPRACLRREYETYLIEQRGLAERTIAHSLRFYDLFLTAKFGDGLDDLDSISPDDIMILPS